MVVVTLAGHMLEFGELLAWFERVRHMSFCCRLHVNGVIVRAIKRVLYKFDRRLCILTNGSVSHSRRGGSVICWLGGGGGQSGYIECRRASLERIIGLI